MEKIAAYIFAQLSAPRVLLINLYTFSRNLCFFILDFFSEDRSANLGRIMLKETLFFPDNSGILFRQSFGKTLWGDGENVFAVHRCENNVVCPVKNFVPYLSLCCLMGLDLQSGFSFRTTRANSVTEKPFVGSAVYNRLIISAKN